MQAHEREDHREEARMEEFRDYYVCENCSNKDFSLVYNFSLRFHGVNFSEELIYDEIVDELYQCTRCKRTVSRAEIARALARIRSRRKGEFKR